MRTQPNHQQFNGAVRVATLVAVLGFAAAALTSGVVLAEHRSGEVEQGPLVVGTGPHAVYVGPAPTVGGDPARGETEESYYARTGRHLPGLSTAIPVVGPWWYGPQPVYGGDPAAGETEASFYARTGRHLGG